MDNLQNFIDNNLNVKIDNGQGTYRGECVSLAIRVAHDVYNVPYGTLYCSNTGGARDLFEQYDGTIPQYFDRIANDTNDYNQLPQRGDLIVWGSYMGKYGHIGIVVSADPLRVYQQLGTPVFTNSEIRQYPNYNGVLGWLRPKQQNNDTINTGASDMITNDDAPLIERLSRRLKLWGGTIDMQKELRAWVGQDWRRFLTEGMDESQELFNTLNDNANKYIQSQPKDDVIAQLNETITSLQETIKTKEKQNNDAQALIEKLRNSDNILRSELDRNNIIVTDLKSKLQELQNKPTILTTLLNLIRRK